MDFALSAEDRAFAKRLRAFFTSEIPAGIRERVGRGEDATREDIVTSQRILNAHGLAVPNWPVEWGIVNGQKTWTTLAQYADWIFCLVRTDPAAQEQRGISMLLIDLASPGVTVRPIRLIDGGSEVNEVFFDNVRVPADQLVGEENRGWTFGKFLLGNERTSNAGLGIIKTRISRGGRHAEIFQLAEGVHLRGVKRGTALHHREVHPVVRRGVDHGT